MTPFLLYLLKINLLIIVLSAFYCLFLRKETFYVWNRFYLLIALIISILLPLIDFSGLFPESRVLVLNLPLAADIRVSGGEKAWYFEDYLTFALIAGMALFACRFTVQLISLLRFKRQTVSAVLNGAKVRIMNDRENAFSFFRWIFINPQMHDSAELGEIIEHEHIHVRQWHTADILLFEIFSIFCWFNPAVWLMKQYVKQNIEFLTDNYILKKGFDKYSYQCNLLKASQFAEFSKIVANFNINCLQSRISMMNKKTSHRIKLLKYSLFIPVCGIMAVCLTAKAEMFSSGQAEFSTRVVITNSMSINPAINPPQNMTIAFDKKIHDFGTVKASEGKTSTVFTFVNLGDKPLIINNVKASCGCTTPEWTKEPVLPGERGYIRAIYNPTSPIAFDKTLTVSTNGNPSLIVLHIKGTVIN